MGYIDRQGNPTYVDAFGDVVMCTTLCHDTWRSRHNDVQRALVAKSYEARVEVDAEVLGLFREQIPDQALGQGEALETNRQRQGCIPDLRLGLQVQLDPRPVDYHPCPGRRPDVPHAGQPDPVPAPPPPLPPRRAPTGEISRYLAELKIIGHYTAGNLPASRSAQQIPGTNTEYTKYTRYLGICCALRDAGRFPAV